MDALTHFTDIGLDSGFKPNPDFDPILYRVLHPTTDHLEALHYPIDGAAPLQKMTVAGAFPDIERLSKVMPLPGVPVQGPLPTDQQERAAAASGFHNDPTELSFRIDEHEYRLISPASNFFFQRFEEDRPFALARLSHGDWDCLYVLQHYKESLAQCVKGLGLTEEHLLQLAARLCDEWHPEQFMFSEHFIPELLKDLRSWPDSPDFFTSVAFKGCPTSDGRLLLWSTAVRPCDEKYLRLFKRHVRTRTFLDATVLKRWLITGELAALPGIVLKRPVILLGPQRLQSLNERWGLKWMSHVAMPSEHAYALRHSLLEECRNSVAEAQAFCRRYNTGRPIFLTQGSSLGYWFIRRLWDEFPDVFYLDLGQAIHAWFYDVEELPVNDWDRFFAPVILENCQLEDFYRSVGITDPVDINLFRDRLEIK